MPERIPITFAEEKKEDVPIRHVETRAETPADVHEDEVLNLDEPEGLEQAKAAREAQRQEALAKVRAELGMSPAAEQESAKTPEAGKPLSPKEAGSVLAKDFPEFEGAVLKRMGQGQNAVTFEVNGEYLFRFPFRLTATVEVGDTEVQAKILESLEGKFSDVEIPRIEYRGKEQNYIGYRKIEGEVLTKDVLETLTPAEREQVGKDMAHFTHQMHTVLPVEKARQAGFEQRPFIKEESRKETEEFVAREFEGNAKAFFQRELERSRELEAEPHKEVALHGDLDLGNIILDQKTKRLKGIIDFGNAIGDVHRDFFYSRLRDREMGEVMTKEYENISGETLSRDTLRTYEVVRELRFLMRYHKNGDTKTFDYWKDKLMKRVPGGTA